jgi:hypothetical protein
MHCATNETHWATQIHSIQVQIKQLLARSPCVSALQQKKARKLPLQEKL